MIKEKPHPEVFVMRPLKIPALLFFLVLCLAVGFAGSWATRPEIPVWYAGLAKPAWNPPPWVFGPVWTFLYICMATAAWLVVRESPVKKVGGAVSWFFIQLIFNGIWSFIFFAWHWPSLAFVDIVLLWVSIGITVGSFWGVRPLAGKLLLPYWIWVTYASTLNFAIWRMNPS